MSYNDISYNQECIPWSKKDNLKCKKYVQDAFPNYICQDTLDVALYELYYPGYFPRRSNYCMSFFSITL